MKLPSRRVAPIVLLALLASACGSSSGSETAGSTTTGSTKVGSTAAGPTAAGSNAAGGKGADPVKVMVISQWDTGVVALHDLPIIVKNGADAANKAGGINGHMVSVEACNDKNDPNGAEGCARQAVADQVTAVIGGFSQYGARIWPVLTTAHIPWIGLLPVVAQDFTDPLSYGVVGGPLLSFAPANLAAQECDSVALLVAQTANQAGYTFLDYAIKSNHKSWSATVKVPSSATDMAPYVAQIAQSGAKCLVALPSQAQWFQLIPAMQSAGLVGKITVYGLNPAAFNLDLVKQFPMQTAGWRSVGYFPTVQGSAAWAPYLKLQTDAGTLGADISKVGDSSETRTWIGWSVFASVLKTMTGPVTAQELIDALDKSCSVNVGAFAPTFDFCKKNTDPALVRIFNTNFSYYQSKGGVLVDYKPGFHDVKDDYLKGKAVG